MDKSICERGFSLLEVLVSFVILALTLSVLLRAYGTSVRNAGIAEQHLRAASVAESLLARLGRDVALQPGEASGEIGAYRWHWLISPYELPPLAPFALSNPTAQAQDEEGEQQGSALRTLPKAFQVRLTLAWGAPASTRSLALSTLRIARQNDPEKPL
ncbi:MAG: type IV pilus modification PilV family protein [Gammaproteobacteria bacterium]